MPLQLTANSCGLGARLNGSTDVLLFGCAGKRFANVDRLFEVHKNSGSSEAIHSLWLLTFDARRYEIKTGAQDR